MNRYGLRVSPCIDPLCHDHYKAEDLLLKDPWVATPFSTLWQHERATDKAWQASAREKEGAPSPPSNPRP